MRQGSATQPWGSSTTALLKALHTLKKNDQLLNERLVERDVDVLVDGGGDDEAAVIAEPELEADMPEHIQLGPGCYKISQVAQDKAESEKFSAAFPERFSTEKSRTSPASLPSGLP
jgi:hypothetical protein